MKSYSLGSNNPIRASGYIQVSRDEQLYLGISNKIRQIVSESDNLHLLLCSKKPVGLSGYVWKLFELSDSFSFDGEAFVLADDADLFFCKKDSSGSVRIFTLTEIKQASLL